jgi:hypothetical protein
MVVEVEQGVRLRIDNEYDVAATPAISAVRAAERLELLTVDGCASVTAVPGGDV